MGIASIDSVVGPAGDAGDGKDEAAVKESTPTYLSGESLTFPLVAGAGTAAITLWSAVRDVEPTVELVIVVAILCGVLVTIWGLIDAKEAAGAAELARGDYFKRAVIGVLNTVLLAAALWGTVAAAQAAYGPG